MNRTYTKLSLLIIIMTNLVIWHWNCNGIKSELTEFKHLLSMKPSPNIICLQESHLKPQNNITLETTGYKVIRKDRLNEPKGGLITMIDPNIPHIEINNPSTLEHQITRIYINNEEYYIINIYDRNTHIDKDQYNMLLKYPNSIIMGDFNAHHKLWGHQQSNKKGNDLLDLINDNNIVLHNDKSPTHIYRHGTNVLDLTLTSSNIAHKFIWKNTNNFLGSDHCIIEISKTTQRDAQQQQQHQQPTKRFNLKRANWKKFTELADKQINEKLITNDPIQTYENLEKQLLTIAHETIPYYNNKQKMYKSWWNDKCTEAIKNRNKARNKAQRTQNIDDIIEFKKAQAVVKRTIKQVKREQWEKTCNDTNNNISKLWDMVNKLKGKYKRRKIATLKDENNNTYVTGETNKAELLATHFARINSNANFTQEFIRHKEEFERTYADELNDSNDYDIPINEPFTLTEFKKAINSKKDTAPGADKILYTFYKHLTDRSLAIALSIFNTLWKTSQLPPLWKHSNVIAILKQSKPPELPTSYRPISLTSNSCKIFETMINNRLKWYLEKNKIINIKQSGFRNHHSTTDHLLTLTDIINKAMATQQTVNTIFLDITKAFDMVWHKGLLYKIRQIGIKGNSYKWIKNFLENRTFTVLVQNSTSIKINSENGVPQGSVLSPTLFNIYINDIPLPPSHLTLFADDIAMWITGKRSIKMHKIIQSKISTIENWANTWGITFSNQKSIAIEFNNFKKGNEHTYYINKQQIPSNNQHKFLGLIFDKRLTWTKHFNYIHDKCQKYLNLMKYITGTTWGANKQTLLLIYKTHIKQLLTYGAPAIIQSSNYQRKVLEKIQNTALKIATRTKQNTSTAAIQIHTGNPPIKLQLLRHTLRYYIKANTYQLPTSSHFEESWQSSYKKTNKELLSEIVKEYKDTNQLPVTPCAPSQTPPWHTPLPEIDIELKDKTIKDNPSYNAALTGELLLKYEEFTKIYTDGSKQIEKVGYGISMPSLNIQKSVRIPNDNTIFSAEATAIITAIEIITEIHINKSVILTDSLSVIQSLFKTNNIHAQKITSLLATATGNNQKIILAWIPSHCGTRGNEEADKLAKQSLNNTEIQTIPYDIHEHNININKYITNKWQKAWNEHRETFYKHIQPIVKYNCQTQTKNVHLESIYTSFILNNAPLNQNLSKIIKNLDPNCLACHTAETPHHYFFECHRYANIRKQLTDKLDQQGATHNVINLLKLTNIIPTTIDYIKHSNRFNTSNR